MDTGSMNRLRSLDPYICHSQHSTIRIKGSVLTIDTSSIRFGCSAGMDAIASAGCSHASRFPHDPSSTATPNQCQ